VCIYIYIYIYVYIYREREICVYIYIYIYIYVCIHIYIYIYIYVCVGLSLCLCLPVRLSVCGRTGPCQHSVSFCENGAVGRDAWPLDRFLATGWPRTDRQTVPTKGQIRKKIKGKIEGEKMEKNKQT